MKAWQVRRGNVADAVRLRSRWNLPAEKATAKRIQAAEASAQLFIERQAALLMQSRGFA
ncbi:MAG: hypothetical protein Fues2KO_24310 [Fuerstiella sp.]